MKLLRKLEDIELKKIIYNKQPNGLKKVNDYKKIEKYKVCFRDASDKVAISTYGAEINSIKRISSVRNELEKYLLPKMDNIDDNISKYVISYQNKNYRIRVVKPFYIDISV